MSSENDELDYDLSAWEVPAPSAGLADAVIGRIGATKGEGEGEGEGEGVPAAVPVEPRAPRSRALVIAGAAAACLVASIGVYGLVRSSRPAGPATGEVVADRARTLALDGIGADLDPGAQVRWRRDGATLRVEQRAGAAAWRVSGDETLVIDAGATVASVKATGASLRVEVEMNSMDARIIGASALTAAAVSLVTITVYSGHVRVTDATHHSVIVQPGASHSVAPLVTPDVVPDRPVVGASVPQQADPSVEADVIIEPGESPTIHASSVPVTVQVGRQTDCRVGFEIANYGDWLKVQKYPPNAKAVLEAGRHKYKVTCKDTCDPFGSMHGCNDTPPNPLPEYGEITVVHDAGRRPLVENMPGTSYIDADGRSYRISFAVAPPDIEVRAAAGRSLVVRDEAGAETVYNTPTIPSGLLEPGTYKFGFARDALTSTMHIEPDLNAPVAYFAKPGPDWHGDVVSVEGKLVRGATLSADNGASDVRGDVRGDFAISVPRARDVVAVRIEHPYRGMHYFVFKPLKLTVKRATPPPAPPPQPTHTTAAPCDPEPLKEKGMEMINKGQHAAALAYFERALACSPDDGYLKQLAYMEACSSKNLAKAKSYYAKLTPRQQSKFLVICTRNKLDPRPADFDFDQPFDPKYGFLAVTSKPAAKILIDGVDTGLTTPIADLPLTPGKHKVTFVIGEDRFTYPVNITPGATAKMFKDLQ